MPLLLLLAFIGVPMLEIAVFIQVGGLIGLWPTLAVVILTALAGSWLLRTQGLATLARGRAQLDNGVLPTREMFDGMCLLFAGALLLTPGFVTDTVGLLLFMPPVRDWLRGFLARQVATRGQTRVWVDGQEVRPGQGPRRPPAVDGVIDVDYEEVPASDPGAKPADPRAEPSDPRGGRPADSGGPRRGGDDQRP